MTLSYYPLVYLPVAAALRGLDPALEETAHVARATGRVRTFLRVVLPQLRPALLGGALLVGLHLLAEFGALQMLRFPTFTTAIYDQYQSTFNGPAASALAGVLVLRLPAAAARRAPAARRTALRPRRRAAPPRPCRRSASARWHGAGRSARPALLVALALGVPLGSLVHWLIDGLLDGVPAAVAASRPRSRSTRAGRGRCGPDLAAARCRWPGWRAPSRAGRARCSSAAPTSATRCPGIVVALALVTVAIRYAAAALPDDGRCCWPPT